MARKPAPLHAFGPWMLKRAAENRERKAAQHAPGTMASGGMCSRGQDMEPRQFWRSRQKKTQPIRVGLLVNGGGVESRAKPRQFRPLWLLRTAAKGCEI